MSTQPIDYPLFSARNGQGLPLVAGKLFTYAAGTTTPLATYTDSTGSTPNTNPVILNARGEAAVWLNTDATYKFILEDAFGNTIWTADNVPGGYIPGGQLTASVIGELLWPATAAEIEAGITPTNFAYPGPGQGDYVDVRRYGAVGDGSTDSTTAIQTAINLINDWTRDPATANPNTTAKGGVVGIPAGVYMVSTTIMVPTGVTLQGLARIPYHGNVPLLAAPEQDQSLPTLRALPSFPVNQYVVDTANWRYKDESGNPVTPYRVVQAADQFSGSLDGVNGTGTPAGGTSIIDLIIDANSIAFGSLRLQMWSYGSIDRVQAIGGQYNAVCVSSYFECNLGQVEGSAPIAFLFLEGASLHQVGSELNYTCAPTSAWTAANQALINSVFYTRNNGTMPAAWYGLTTKGILAYWTGNLTFDKISGYNADVGIEFFRVDGTIYHYENEFTTGVNFLGQASNIAVHGFSNKAGVPLATGSGDFYLRILWPKFMDNSGTWTSFNGETTSTLTVELWGLPLPDPELGSAPALSLQNITRVFQPTSNKLATPQRLVLNANANTGSVTTSGLGFTSGPPSTIDGCLNFIAMNPQVPMWEIVLADGMTHTIGLSHTLEGVDILITRDFSSTVPTLTATSLTMLINSRLRLGALTLGGWTTTALFEVQGTLDVDATANSGAPPTISIPAGKTLFMGNFSSLGAGIVRMSGSGFSMTFGAGAALCQGGSNGEILYSDAANALVTGTPLLEAISSGRVQCSSSQLVPTTFPLTMSTASATAGTAGAVPGTAAGFITFTIAGTVHKIPYFNA